MKTGTFAPSFCGHLVVNKAPVLLCPASELPGEVELSLGIWTAGCHQTSLGVEVCFAHLGLVSGGSNACKATGLQKMTGRVYLDCVKPLAFCSASGFPVV